MQPPAWATPRQKRYRFIKMLVLTLAVVLSTGWTLASVLHHPSTFDQPLRFTENGSFQISIFEDLHFGEGMSQPSLIPRDSTDFIQSPG